VIIIPASGRPLEGLGERLIQLGPLAVERLASGCSAGRRRRAAGAAYGLLALRRLLVEAVSMVMVVVDGRTALGGENDLVAHTQGSSGRSSALLGGKVPTRAATVSPYCRGQQVTLLEVARTGS
jgi:hypothetical protein